MEDYRLPNIELSVRVPKNLKVEGTKRIASFKKKMAPYHKRAIQAAEAAMKKQIMDRKLYTSGALWRSVTGRLLKSNSEMITGEVFFDKRIAPYANIVDEGMGGTDYMPPAKKIKAWMKFFDWTKAVYIDKRGRRRKASVFVISRHLHMEGYKAKPFYAVGSKKAVAAYNKIVKEGISRFRGK